MATDIFKDFEDEQRAESSPKIKLHHDFADAIKTAMLTPAGRRIIFNLLAMQPPLQVGCIPDPHTNGYIAGRRSITAEIMEFILAECLKDFDIMNQEAKENTHD